MHAVVFHRHAGRVRNRGTGADVPLGEIVSGRSARPGYVPGWPRIAVRRTGHAGVDAGLAEIFLSVGLDIAGVHLRAEEPLAGPTAFSGLAATRRLAAGNFAIARRADLRVLLGDVELLVLAAMDLSHARRAIPARLRNAAAGLRRLHPLRAGTVRAEKSSLGTRAKAGAMKRGFLPKAAVAHPRFLRLEETRSF